MTYELYDVILTVDTNGDYIAYPSYKTNISGGVLPAIPNLLYITKPVLYLNTATSEIRNHLAVTSDNTIIEYKISVNSNSNTIVPVYTYTDVDTSYNYTLFVPYIVGYKPDSNKLILYNRQTHQVSYTTIPADIKPQNANIEKALQLIHMEVKEGD